MSTTLEAATIRRPSRLLLAVLALGLIIAAGFLSPLISLHNPDAIDLLNRAAPPVGLGGSWAHPLGTDQIGRDILSRSLFGIRTSFSIATLGLIFSAVLGIGLGIISGLAGAWTDRIIMTIVDVFISLPNLLLMLCGIALLGTETWVLVVLIGFVKWEGYARLVRGQVLAIREQGYIEAARVLGARNLTIALKHVLPNLASPLAVILTLSFPGVLLMEAGLSFLGVGVQPPVASLGRMIDDGRNYLVDAWWISGIPSIVIVAITLLFQIIGDALRDRVDEWLDA